jgi:hypothetical protein
MKIDYKKPYWLKYSWDLETHNEHQFVTPFNKKDSELAVNFLYDEKYTILCSFKILETNNKDIKAGIFGKAGQNFGLNFDYSINSLVFEFRTIDDKDEIKFHCVIIDKVNSKMVNDGVTILIIKQTNELIFYCDNVIVANYTYDCSNLIEDYRNAPLYIGCLNPGAFDLKDKCFSEIEIKHLSIIKDNDSFDNAISLLNIDYHELPTKSYYNDIIGLYDFDLINNYGIIFDNSKYSHFLELVPKEFLA